jgi:FlaA1/EpsC-like NDP-sugar epimerase
MTIVFILLPFYGQQDGEFISSVTLLSYNDISTITRTVYFSILILMIALGIVELIIHFFEDEKGVRISKICSIILHALAILIFTMTRQPYVTAFLFMLIMIKVVLLLKGNRIR